MHLEVRLVNLERGREGLYSIYFQFMDRAHSPVDTAVTSSNLDIAPNAGLRILGAQYGPRCYPASNVCTPCHCHFKTLVNENIKRYSTALYTIKRKTERERERGLKEGKTLSSLFWSCIKKTCASAKSLQLFYWPHTQRAPQHFVTHSVSSSIVSCLFVITPFPPSPTS